MLRNEAEQTPWRWAVSSWRVGHPLLCRHKDFLLTLLLGRGQKSPQGMQQHLPGLSAWRVGARFLRFPSIASAPD